MKKKFFAMYALAGALVASPVFTSCVDDSVSPQVEAQREANIKYKNAQTAQLEAQTAINQANAALTQEAQRIQNEFNAASNEHQKAVWAYNEAINAYNLADRAYEEAIEEANRALQAELDSLGFVLALEKAKNAIESAKRAEEQAKIDLENSKITLEQSKRQEAIDAAKAELEMEKALVEAEKNLVEQKKILIEKQNLLDTELAKLDEKVKGEAQLLNANAKAIMLGGTFTKPSGEEISYNGSDYVASENNSIFTLNEAIAKENVNLLKYEAKLIDVEAYVKQQTALQNKNIAVAEATIANYKELQAAGTYEAMKKKYDEAVKNSSALTDKQAEAVLVKMAAKDAFNAYIAAENAKLGTEEANAVYAYIAEQLAENSTSVKYMTSEDVESGDSELSAKKWSYDNTANLDGDITTAEGAVTTAEGNIQTRKDNIEQTKKDVADDIVDLERNIVIEKAAVKALQDAQAALKAEAGYATHIATLTDAVTAAKTAFETTPSQPNKTALENAELALANADATYPATPGATTIADYENQLKENGGFDTNNNLIEDENNVPIGYEAYVANMEAELALLKALTEDVDFELYYMAENSLTDTLEDLEAALVEKQEALAELEALKEMFAEESEAMAAYEAWVEGLEELRDAYDEVEDYSTEQGIWSGIVTDLENYVTRFDGSSWTEGSLDYAALIEKQEEAIATAKAAIAQLAYKDEGGNEIEMTYDDIIKKSEAKIAAMEAELEIRQAEYDAIMKELDALVEAETETAE